MEDPTYDVVIVEALGSGSGLRIVRAGLDLGMHVLFVTVGRGRYVDDYDRSLLEEKHERLEIMEGVDTGDATAVEAVLSSVLGRFRGVVSQVDRSILPTATACRKLGVPFLDPDVLVRCADKGEFRLACAENAVSTVRAVTSRSVADAVRGAEGLGLPVVVKPSVGTSSQNVALAYSVEQVRVAAERILAASDGRAQVLIEEYLVGPLVSAEVFRHGGRTHVLGLTDRTLSPVPDFWEVGEAFPLVLGDSDRDGVIDVCTRVLDVLGFDRGPAHIELILAEDGPRVVEVNPRMGGRGLSYMTSQLSEWSVHQATLLAAVGEEPHRQTPPRPGYAAEHAVLCRRPPVDPSAALARVRALPGVWRARLVDWDRAPIAYDGHREVGEVVAGGETYGEAVIRARAAAQFLQGAVDLRA